ncbi:MAG: kelch repeat-containing protein [Polaribacter sp.]|uniref:Kelch repeat-containing protein n=1 Tax=Polaribacter sp. TaxID=1920175 RepID=UPI00384D635D
MIKIFASLLYVSLILIPITGNSQGIRFNSSASSIVERTSYNVFVHDQPKFSGNFSIEFDLSIIDSKVFGYVLNIKDKDNPISYSLAYIYNTGGNGELKLNLDGVKKLLSVPIEKELIGSRKWMKIVLNFNSTSKEITLKVNDKIFSSIENEFNNTIVPEIHFGKHGSVIDVPLMAIKNLIITNKKQSTLFNFNESNGNDVYDSNGDLFGDVDHPNWLITESYHWKLISEKSFDKVTSVTFDENNNRFIYQNTDTLSFYNHTNNKSSFYSFKNTLTVPMRLGTSFLDPSENKLYVYELSDVLDGKSTIASIDLKTPEYWGKNSSLKLSQQRHHHNGFFNPKSNKYLIFGGYGNQRFTNAFNSYDIKNDKWEPVTFTGDIISPRFFAGMTHIGNQNLLLFGGQGNETGEQSIGKTYYYDCYKINLKTNNIQKLWDVKQENTKMVSARNMVLSKDSTSFYTIGYSEYNPSTFLQLYNYSIKDGSHKIFGNSIPMISEKIRTNANLYLNNSTNQFFCVTQEFEEDGSNKINIYSLNDQPVSKDNIYIIEKKSSSNIVFTLIILLLMSGVLYYLKYLKEKRKKKKNEFKAQVQNILKPQKRNKIEIKSNATFLFGSFRIIDKKKKDISYLFSPKIRQLFLLLLFSSKQKGVSGLTSERIHSTLWPDSTPQKAKNLKNVIISQLRKILKDIDGLELIYSKSRFFMEIEDEFYCDYFNFSTQLESLRDDLLDYNSLNELTNLISPGKFLLSINDECFDKIKKNFEYEILKIIPNQLKRMYTNKDYSPIIPLTEILFNIDSLNETAFYYRIHTLHNMDLTLKAKKQFNDYIIRYNKIMGDNFPGTYKDVIKQIPDELI